LRNLFKRFLADHSGATALEYALIVTFLSIVVATAITNLGQLLYNLLLKAILALN